MTSEERRKSYMQAYQKRYHEKLMKDPEKVEKYRAYHRDYDKAYRAKLYENHLCAYCRKKDEKTMAGYALCKTCADKANAHKREKYRQKKLMEEQPK